MRSRCRAVLSPSALVIIPFNDGAILGAVCLAAGSRQVPSVPSSRGRADRPEDAALRVSVHVQDAGRRHDRRRRPLRASGLAPDDARSTCRSWVIPSSGSGISPPERPDLTILLSEGTAPNRDADCDRDGSASSRRGAAQQTPAARHPEPSNLLTTTRCGRSGAPGVPTARVRSEFAVRAAVSGT